MNYKDKTLIQLLDEAGIRRIYENGRKKGITYLEYKGKQIGCPRHDRCYEVVKREFGIDLTTFND